MQLSFAHILSGLICKQVCFLLRCWCASIHPRLTNDAERMKKSNFRRRIFLQQLVKRLNMKINCLFIIDKQVFFWSCIVAGIFLLKIDFHPSKGTILLFRVT